MPVLVVGGVLLVVAVVVVVFALVLRPSAREAELSALLAEEAQEADTDESHPIHRLARTIVEDAYSRGASAIHIGTHEQVDDEGRAERRCCVRYRVDGALDERMQLPVQAVSELLARFAHMAALPARSHGGLEEGRIEFRRFSRVGLDVDIGVARWGAGDDERCVLHLRARARSRWTSRRSTCRRTTRPACGARRDRGRAA
jgi:type II secretory ATPase GspE/PulE/Tfp pilus assembly ATPase PilB-like protein